MTAVEKRYSTGIIYRLQGTDGSYYIGSTTRTLDDRIRAHRIRAEEERATPVCKHFNHIGWENVTASILSKHNNITKAELFCLETETINPHLGQEGCLNKKLPFRSFDDSRRVNAELQAAARAKSPERMAKYRQEWAAKIVSCPDCNIEMRRGQLSEHKNSAKHKRAILASRREGDVSQPSDASQEPEQKIRLKPQIACSICGTSGNIDKFKRHCESVKHRLAAAQSAKESKKISA